MLILLFCHKTYQNSSLRELSFGPLKNETITSLTDDPKLEAYFVADKGMLILWGNHE